MAPRGWAHGQAEGQGLPALRLAAIHDVLTVGAGVTGGGGGGGRFVCGGVTGGLVGCGCVGCGWGVLADVLTSVGDGSGVGVGVGDGLGVGVGVWLAVGVGFGLVRTGLGVLAVGFGVAFGLAAGDGGGLRLTTGTTGTADAGRTTTAGGSSLRACSLRVLLVVVEWCTRRTALAAA